MDESRKRVLLIAASILAARKLAQYDGGKRVPATMSAIAALRPALVPLRARSFGTEAPQDDAVGKGWFRIEPLPAQRWRQVQEVGQQVTVSVIPKQPRERITDQQVMGPAIDLPLNCAGSACRSEHINHLIGQP